MSGSIEVIQGLAKTLSVNFFNINGDQISDTNEFEVKWSSNTPGVSVNENGRVSAAVTGAAEIVASYGNIQATASLSITAPLQPDEVSDLVVWLDHTDDSTLFDQNDVGQFLPSEYGDPVAKWEDKSGNLNHFEQSGVGDRPIRTSTGVDFEQAGSSGELSTAASVSGSATVLVRFTCNNPSAAGIFVTSDNVDWIAGGADLFRMGINSSQYSTKAASEALSGSYTSGNRDTFVATYNWDNGDSSMYVNGSLLGNSNIGAATSGDGTTDQQTQEMRIGDSSGRGDQDNLSVLDGEISGLLVYNRILTDEERSGLENYLATL